MKQQLDTLFINNLVVPCVIGISENERRKKQKVIITIELSIDTRTAGKTDDINDTVSYSTIATKIFDMVSDSQFYLLEKLAQSIADVCLHDKHVMQVKVHIEKPKALQYAKSSAITIIRTND